MQVTSEERDEILGSLLKFTCVFYKLLTNREFLISRPIGREPMQITVARALMECEDHQVNRRQIRTPPRYGKTIMAVCFIAWTLARWPDCNNIYVSYAHSLARKHTGLVKEIMMLPQYQHMFDARIKRDASAKDNFETVQGGSVYAVGSGGTITGRGAGIQGLPDDYKAGLKDVSRYGGCILIDDIHKPDEVFSDTIRQGILEWYFNTLSSRVNSPHTPIIAIWQMLHEDDLGSNLGEGNKDVVPWDVISLPALDGAGNALNPAMHDVARLKEMQLKMPYEYSSQYQQKPTPAGGSVFKREWFMILDNEPEIIATFVTADTAETDKTWNDQTVFSFWGLYRIQVAGMDTELYGLHWLSCEADWINAGDLHSRFMSFYSGCMRHPIKPRHIAIEAKSTGVTLRETLKDVQGLNILEAECLKPGVSKAARFIKCQPIVTEKLISFPADAKHVEPCLSHLEKITLIDSHMLDDIADTMAIAIQIALLDKVIVNMNISIPKQNKMLEELMGGMRAEQKARNIVHGTYQR
jgi:hypothetical protein